MRGIPFNLSGKGALDAVAAQILVEEDKGGTFWSGASHRKKKDEILEPRSVLYHSRSPSPPTSTSTLSSSLSGACGGLNDTGGAAAVSEIPSQKEECGVGVDDWEMMLAALAASPNQEQTFLRWIMGDLEDLSPASKLHPSQVSFQNPPSEFDTVTFVEPLLGFEPPSSSACLYQVSRNTEGKNANFVNTPTAVTSFFQEPPNLLQANTLFNPSFFLPLSPFATASEHHHTPNFLFPPRPPMPNDSGVSAAVALQQRQSLVDHLFKAAEFVESGNFSGANGILARLNHELSSPLGKPLLRSAFYFKEALQLLAANSYGSSFTSSSPSQSHCTPPFATSLINPLDVILKLSAHKAFSEISPVLHFTNFTMTQALLEELGTAGCIHIIDFDIGIGGQWSSFMQELAQRKHSSAMPQLKITAFVSPGSFHPLELHLTCENLSQFAADLNIPFEINISNIESFDPAGILAVLAGCNEAIAVSLPVGAGLQPSFATILRLVKQLMPKIVVSVDQGCDRSDLPFSHHFVHALQSSMVLLDSIDATGSNLDMVNKIERFVLQPRIENSVIGRYRSADKVLQWRTLFSSAGFQPVHFSNFAEMQAECLLKRVQLRGFRVEKQQASLCLNWQQGELVSVSAWRC